MLNDSEKLEIRKEHQRKKYAENPEPTKARSKRWKEENRDRAKELDHIRYMANRDKAIERARQWRINHPEQDRMLKRRWEAAHPEATLLKVHRRRARKLDAPRNDLTLKQWQAIKAYYGQKCVYCGRKTARLTQDHITPLSKGGSHTVSNVLPACRPCNSKKGVGAPPIPVQPLLLL